jgi:filamentous hemagglutinin family protein
MRKPLISVVAAGAMLFFYPMYAFSAPIDGLVVKGQANIVQRETSTVIDQASARAVIDWRGFDIGANEMVRFNQQQGANSVALNRVTSGAPTSILGQLSANGRVFITNPNGIVFGATAKIDVAGLLATTLSIDSEDFMGGRNLFTQDLSKAIAYVVNKGEIRIADNGFCFLVAPGVTNEGTIVGQLGKVVMASGRELTLDMNGDGLMTYTVSGKVLENVIGPDGKPMDAAVSNSGTISAKGGEIVMVGSSGADVFTSVVNNSGIIEASALDVAGGSAVLSGGDEGITRNSGTIDVSGKGSGQKGGTVKVLGDKVGLFDGTRIDASGANGGGTVLVGGDYQGKNPGVQNASRTYVDRDVQINASATGDGDGGKVVVWANGGTRFYGNISARGGQLGGNGGFAEVSGKGYLDYQGLTDLRASRGITGTLLLDPNNITIQSAVPDMRITGSSPFTSTDDSSILSTETLIDALSRAGVQVETGTEGVSSQYGDITVNSAVTWSSGNTLTLVAHRDILLNAAVGSTIGNTVLTATAGSISGTGVVSGYNVTLSAGKGIGSTNAPLRTTSTGMLSLTSSGVGAEGDISVSESNALNTNRLMLATTGAGVQTVKIIGTHNEGITVGGNIGTTEDSITLNTTSGMIREGIGTVTGNNVTLDSETGVGTNADNRVQTAAGSLFARSRTSGGVYVNEVDAVTLTGPNLAAGGPYDLIAGGNIALAGDVGSTGGDTSLRSGGNITRRSGKVIGNQVTLEAIGGIGSTSAPVYTESTGILRLTSSGAGSAGDIAASEANALNTSRLALAMNGTGAHTLTIIDRHAGGITVNSNIGKALDNIILSTTEGSILDAGGTITGDSVTLNSASGVGTDATHRVKTAANTLSAGSAGNGGVYVREADDVILTSIDGVEDMTRSGDYDVDAAGTITIGGAITSLSGDIVLAGAAIAQNSNVVTGETGKVTMAARNGAITMADGTVTWTIDGAINYTATGDVALSHLISYVGDINVTAGSGSSVTGAITDNKISDKVSNVITAGSVMLTAKTGIGTSAVDGDIDMTVGRLASAITHRGGIYLQSTHALAVDRIDAGPGIVSLRSVGSIIESGNDDVADITGGTLNLEVTAATATIGASSNPLEIDASVLNARTTGGGIWLTDIDGGVSVDLVNAGGTSGGTVVLTSLNGGIFSFGKDAENEIVGKDVTIDMIGSQRHDLGEKGNVVQIGARTLRLGNSSGGDVYFTLNGTGDNVSGAGLPAGLILDQAHFPHLVVYGSRIIGGAVISNLNDGLNSQSGSHAVQPGALSGFFNFSSYEAPLLGNAESNKLKDGVIQ